MVVAVVVVCIVVVATVPFQTEFACDMLERAHRNPLFAVNVK